jgi:hypothetical protein
MNQDYGGIHCWGNVVYCCSECNNKKSHFKGGDWRDYLQHTGKTEQYSRWVSKYNNGEEESLELVVVCKEIYEHVGTYLREKVDKV